MHRQLAPHISVLFFLSLGMACGGSSSSGDPQGSAQDGSPPSGSAQDGSAQTGAVKDASSAADREPVGLAWTLATSGTEQDLYTVIWAGNRIIAAGDNGTVLSSNDGSSWTRLETGLTDNFRSLAWTGSRLVAISKEGKILTSEDGTTWTARGTNLKPLRRVAWTGKLLVALGEDENSATSTDGITWAAHENDALYDFVPMDAVWTGNQLIWVGYTTATQYSMGTGTTSPTTGGGWALGTKDGVAFTDLSPEYKCNSILGAAWQADEYDPVFSGSDQGHLIGAGRNGEMFLMYSGNWVSGKWREDGYGSTSNLNAVVWTGAEAVAVGDKGTVLRSLTGHYLNWTKNTVPSAADFNAIAWTGARVVAVGSGGTIITSP